MDIAKMLGVDIDVKEIEKQALEAKEVQAKMLAELIKVNTKLSIIAHAAEEFVKHIQNGGK